ncbi:hypothetical protein PR048_012596 [Dryococelus australis]|uniref:Uncharacterized protein n=1 Tax=Dryococelus australis TaxID=614101 RepID=A0ABQ9HQ31_9NEOP|nr:hypothetical protein PR048_012596 [Dryococelus australis]
MHVDALLQSNSASIGRAKSLHHLLFFNTENIFTLKARNLRVNCWNLTISMNCIEILIFRMSFPTLNDFVKFFEKHCTAQNIISPVKFKTASTFPSKSNIKAPSIGLPDFLIQLVECSRVFKVCKNVESSVNYLQRNAYRDFRNTNDFSITVLIHIK